MLLAQPAPNWFVGRFNNLWCDCFVLTDVRAYFFFVLAFEIQDEDWCSAKCHCLCRGACLNLCSARHQHTRTKLIKDRHKRGDFGGKHDRRPWQKAEADSDQKMRNKIIQHVIWNRSAARGDHLSARCHWDSFMSELNLSINVISTRARKKNIKSRIERLKFIPRDFKWFNCSMLSLSFFFVTNFGARNLSQVGFGVKHLANGISPCFFCAKLSCSCWH